jgi:hypothetical protein
LPGEDWHISSAGGSRLPPVQRSRHKVFSRKRNRGRFGGFHFIKGQQWICFGQKWTFHFSKKHIKIDANIRTKPRAAKPVALDKKIKSLWNKQNDSWKKARPPKKMI